ncbi:PREDICTED: protein SUPPRESSOR OF npr1-1, CONSTITUTIVE 1 [Tarenaya hassleriana]|uniref:protein SUPPRESSOR OF npr1-1, CONSTITUTIVE 1 n=2 Tax=Tarenaya hassleriana TaxID=28532 RepID=UPI0008FD00F6|nr:PREDICTED: protein SUPPRESSOR OF npr1-1, CONSTITUTIVE 1 [Tarenaya hassleriana]
MDVKELVTQHQVYISFRGSESRHGFVSHLVRNMKRAGINVFIDSDLQRGEDLENLWKRIEESRVALVILSSGYLDSNWCLDELVEIMKLVKEGKLVVIPIFFKVDVRRLKGDLGNKFRNLERASPEDRITKWKDALEYVVRKMGLTLEPQRSEADFIDTIVEAVKRTLIGVSSEDGRVDISRGKGENTEMEQWLKQLEEKLEFQQDTTRLVGVVGGHGRIQLVKELFKKWENKFQSGVLLENVDKMWQEYGLCYLRMMLLEKLLTHLKIRPSTTQENDQLELKVLVVLDGVSDKTQIEVLLQNHKWIKKGSKIVITTSDKSPVVGLVDDIYELCGSNFTNDDQSYHVCAPKGHMTKPSMGGKGETHQERKQAIPEEVNELHMRKTDHISVFFCSDKQEADEASFMEDILRELRKHSITPLTYSLTGRKILNLGMQRRFGVGIIIFSNNYAFSRECLDQLVTIMEHRKANDLLIIPIYFKVTPSDIRECQGSFKEAFLQLANSYQAEQVHKWRTAIIETASVDGYEWTKGNHFTLVKKIVRNACLRLYSRTSENLTNILSLLEHSQTSDMHTVGIWGMAGIGKTTIATEIFEILAPRYDSCYFLQDFHQSCQKKGLNSLRDDFFSKIFGEENLGMAASSIKPSFMRNMFQHKRVLIILDDVSNAGDAEALVGGFGWLSPGHMVILTSRNRQVLIRCNVEEPYEVLRLSEYESFRLSKQYLTEETYPISDIMNYANGIPLALLVSCSSSSKQQTNNMREHVQELRKNPPPEIQKAFERSFDGLDENEKNIFLDLACFFRGENRDHVVQLLDACGFFTDLGICGLIDESLITLLHDRIEMQIIFEDMGRFVVLKEDKEPGKRSRLWDADDIADVLTSNSGTEAIEGIFLDASNLRCEFHPTVFNSMYSIRLIKFYYSTSGNQCNLCLPQGLESLPDELRLLHWENYPLKSLPQEFNPENLVELNLPHSEIENLWEGTKDLGKLKMIRLSHSRQLSKIPKLSKALNLEHIDVEGCTGLVKVSSSIQYLGKLIVLNLKGCSRLQTLPAMVNLKSLEVLNLSGCSELENIQDFSENIREIYLSGTAIREVPSSIENLSKLAILDLENCKRLQHLPMGVSYLKSLGTLKLSGCSNLVGLQNLDALYLRCLQHLDATKTTTMEESSHLFSHHSAIKESKLDGSQFFQNSFALQFRSDTANTYLTYGAGEEHVAAFKYSSIQESSYLTLYSLGRLPSSILYSLALRLYALACLSLPNACLLDIPADIFCLPSLRKLDLSGNGFSQLPESIKQFSKLEVLLLSYCKNLTALPSELPQSLEILDVHGCTSLESFPSYLLPSIWILDLSGNGFSRLPESIKEFSKLEVLLLRDCKNLTALPSELPQSLETLDVHGCTSLESFPSYLLPSLWKLDLSGNGFSRLPESIKEFSKLEVLLLRDCKNLTALPSELPQSLETLDVHGCTSLESFPSYLLPSLWKLDLSGNGFSRLPESIKEFSKLEVLLLRDCKNLTALPSELPQSLETLDAHGCTSLESITWCFERIPRQCLLSNCFALSPAVVKDLAAKALAGFEHMELFGAQPGFNVCLPTSVGEIPTMRISTDPWITMQLASQREKQLVGFVLSVVVAFSDNNSRDDGFGVRCIGSWRARKGSCHRSVRIFWFWKQWEVAPKLRHDHTFVFYQHVMHPAGGKKYDEVEFEFYPVKGRGMRPHDSCTVKQCGAYDVNALIDKQSPFPWKEGSVASKEGKLVKQMASKPKYPQESPPLNPVTPHK